MKSTLITLLTLFLNVNYSYSQIRINEVCSSNKGVYFDEKSDTPDWIELYNYSDEPVNLKSWRISDNSNYDEAWQLPDTLIEPGEYFLVCASGKDTIASTMRIISNGVSTHYNAVEEQLSWAYLKLKKDDVLSFSYDSFKSTFNPVYDIAKAGVMIKDKNEPNSRMLGFFHTSDEGRQFFKYFRDEPDLYRGVSHFKDRVKLDDYRYKVSVLQDSIVFSILDSEEFEIKRLPNQFQYSNQIFIGFTVKTYDILKYDTLNINDIELNGKRIDIDDFNINNFNNTSLILEKVDFYHTDFKLSKETDSLFLFENNVLNSKNVLPELLEDISFSDYDGERRYYDTPTPNKKNNEFYSSITKINDIDTDTYYFSDRDEFDLLDSSYYYTTNFRTPDENSNLLNSYKNDSSELLTIQKIILDKNDSELLRIPRLSKDEILNDELHFHIYTDSSNLYNNHNGIINKTFSYSKVKAFLTITKNNVGLFKGNIELRKHGNYSNIDRLQASLRLHIDKNSISQIAIENLFPEKKNLLGKSVILRNGGNDKPTMLRNRLANIKAKDLNLEWIEHNNVLVFLNSNFWGVYNVRERIDDDYLAEKYKVKKSEINSFENNIVLKHGTPNEIIELNNQLVRDSLNLNYNDINKLIDLEVFIDYIFINTFNINHDWPWNNVTVFSIGKKWKFLNTDLDYSYRLRNAGASVDFMSQVFEKEDNFTTRLLKSLLKTDTFRIRYMNRVCDILNSSFKSDSLVNKFLDLKERFSKNVEIQNSRWPETLANWEEDTYVIEKFLNRRPNFYYQHIQDYFDKKPAELNLTSFPNTAGGFKVNTLTIDESKWTGKYLQEVPVTITAVPKQGYKFKNWSIDSLGNTAEITISLPETINLQAIYEEADPNDNSINIVINEIMYNADKDKDTKDWIELYNAGTDAVNLNGWSLIDEDDSHTPYVINEDYTIQPDEYIILTRSQSDFGTFINIDNKIFSDLDYGFGGNDLVKLLDANGFIHDTVNYDNDLPWPEGADGTGYTIELIHPGLDNSLAENWELSKPELGTAGFVNSVFNDSSTNSVYYSSDSKLEIDFIDKQLSVRSNNEITSISLYDLSGKEIYLDYNINYNIVKSSLKSIPNGLYLLNVQLLDGNEETVKLIVD